MKYNIFYSSYRDSLSVVNAKLGSKESDVSIYHTSSDDDINAVKVYSNKNAELLYNDGTIEDGLIHHTRKMDYQYEQYIVCESFRKTYIKIGFYGCINGFRKHSSRYGNIEINDNTVILGNAYNVDDIWNWKTDKCDDNISISVNTDNIADIFNTDKCLFIGSSDPIEFIGLYDPEIHNSRKKLEKPLSNTM